MNKNHDTLLPNCGDNMPTPKQLGQLMEAARTFYETCVSIGVNCSFCCDVLENCKFLLYCEPEELRNLLADDEYTEHSKLIDGKRHSTFSVGTDDLVTFKTISSRSTGATNETDETD